LRLNSIALNFIHLKVGGFSGVVFDKFYGWRMTELATLGKHGLLEVFLAAVAPILKLRF
jgi:hypothetical protein